MDTGKLDEVKRDFEEVKINASTSYQGSLAYECDINEVANGLQELISLYSDLQTMVNSNNSLSGELEYENIVFFTSSSSQRISPLIADVEDLLNQVKTKSEIAYTSLNNDYNFKCNIAETNITKAEAAKRSYESLSRRLSSMDADNPLRSSIKKAMEAAEIAFDSAIGMASGAITKLDTILNDGYKRM